VSRPVGLTQDAGWEIGVSRTVAAPREVVWDLLVSDEGRALWLGAGATPATEKGAPWSADDGTAGELRSFRPPERIRLTWRPPGWDHDSTVQVVVTAKGPDRTVINFHQERLAGAAEREHQRAHWSAVLDRLVGELAD
jgi:uncharacterized protein YndB with AHSA1/START domain